MIKSWSTNQAVVALSPGEAEYHGLVKAASVWIGVQAISRDLGRVSDAPIVIKSDASAAIGIASRIGIGKVRHIEVTQLWLQEKVAGGTIIIEKVPSRSNLADAMTKAMDREGIDRHVQGVNAERRKDRHPIAPAMEWRKGEDGGVIEEQE